MESQIETVKDIADGMIGIGGIPNNEEFYAEFNSRVTAKLGIKTECKWRHVDMGMYGCSDYVYQTSCNKEYDSNKTSISKFCPNCGNAVVF
jgi:ribosomal protein L33